MDILRTYVSHLAQLRHTDALDFTKKVHKKQPDTRKVLSLLASLEHAYFDGKILVPVVKGKLNSSLDMKLKYDEVATRLTQVFGTPTPPPSDATDGGGRNDDAEVASVLKRYCSIRKELISVHRDLHAGGINFVENIPRLRSLVTQATDLKPDQDKCDDSRTVGYQQQLYNLANLELQFLLNINQCLWEGNRLQLPASVFHLTAAKKRLSALQSIVPTNRRSARIPEKIDFTQSGVKLLSFLASIYSSSHGKVSLIFLHTLTDNINTSVGFPTDTDSESSDNDVSDCPIVPIETRDLLSGIRLQSTTNLAHLAEQHQDRLANENLDNVNHGDDPAMDHRPPEEHSSDCRDASSIMLSFNQCPDKDLSDQPFLLPDSEYYNRIKQTIDEAYLLPIWPILKNPKKPGLANTLANTLQVKRSGEDEPEKLQTSSNILKALDALLDECQTRIGSRPVAHILYNAAARGFEGTLNLTDNRVIAAKYLPCGHRELSNGDHLKGIKGIPCIATYPKRKPSCPLSVLAQVSTLPLHDAGVISLLPINHYINLKRIERPRAKGQQQHHQHQHQPPAPSRSKRRIEPSDFKRLLSTKSVDLSELMDDKTPRHEVDEPEKTEEVQNDITSAAVDREADHESPLMEDGPGRDDNADDTIDVTLPMHPSQEGVHPEQEPIDTNKEEESLQYTKVITSRSDVLLPHQNSSMLLSLPEDDGSVAGTTTDISPSAPYNSATFAFNAASPPVSPRLGSFNNTMAHIVENDFVPAEEHDTKSNNTNEGNNDPIEAAEETVQTGDDDGHQPPSSGIVVELNAAAIEQVKREEDRNSKEAVSPHSIPPPVTPPPSPRATDTSFCPSPEVGSYVAATRIDLLFYFALAFEVPPSESDANWISDWLTKFANCTATGSVATQFFTPLTKEVCSVK